MTADVNKLEREPEQFFLSGENILNDNLHTVALNKEIPSDKVKRISYIFLAVRGVSQIRILFFLLA